MLQLQDKCDKQKQAKPLYAVLNHVPKLLLQDQCDKQAEAAGMLMPKLLAKPVYVLIRKLNLCMLC